MKKEGFGPLTVAATYIGTVVGAGFATGQEVLQFFLRFGALGVTGLLLVTFLFILFGIIIMDFGKQLHAASHLDIVRHTSGKITSAATDAIITFFLFGSLTTMFAGTGALFTQQFHLPALFGNTLMAVFTALTVLGGIRGVITSISYVVPFLLAAVIGLSVYSMLYLPDSPALSPPLVQNGLLSNWFLSAILYVSYNTIISVAVLGPLGAQARNHKAIGWGAVLGGLGLGATSFMIFFALANNPAAADAQVPMLSIASRISPTAQILYAAVLTAEIYTTAVGSLFGFTSRFAGDRPSLSGTRITVIITTVAAFFASQCGFSNLVQYLYPAVGYGGILLLVCLFTFRYFHKKI